MPTGLNCTPNDGATDWIAPSCPPPETRVASRRTATRVTRGAICLRCSSHLPPMEYSKSSKPVMLPPGRARLSTKPPPTESATAANTTGTVRVTCCNSPKAELPLARMTSGARATNSAAYLRVRSVSPPPQRLSIRMLRPTAQPASCNPCRNAAWRACVSGSSAAWYISVPTRRTRSRDCPRAASGHVVAPPSSVMNSRRRMGLPQRHRSRTKYSRVLERVQGCASQQQRVAYVRVGSFAGITAPQQQCPVLLDQQTLEPLALSGFYTIL